MYETKPALTPERWAEAADQRALQTVLESASAEVDAWNPPSRHALAALALHGQSFGFTHEMLRALREGSERWGAWSEDRGYSDDELAFWNAVDQVADRIAALLPPREEVG